MRDGSKSKIQSAYHVVCPPNIIFRAVRCPQRSNRLVGGLIGGLLRLRRRQFRTSSGCLSAFCRLWMVGPQETRRRSASAAARRNFIVRLPKSERPN
jgi:hypothetical protein